jgi:hypothetical protein
MARRDLVRAVNGKGAGPALSMVTEPMAGAPERRRHQLELAVSGMTCASCAARVEKS